MKIDKIPDHSAAMPAPSELKPSCHPTWSPHYDCINIDIRRKGYSPGASVVNPAGQEANFLLPSQSPSPTHTHHVRTIRKKLFNILKLGINMYLTDKNAVFKVAEG